MKKFLGACLSMVVIAGSLLVANDAQAFGNFADCFSASGSVNSARTEYTIDIDNSCQFSRDTPFGIYGSYRVELGGSGYCGSDSGRLWLSSFGPTLRFDLDCLSPGSYRPQVTFSSFSDGSSNYEYLSSFTISAPSPSPTPKPTPTPTPKPTLQPVPTPTPTASTSTPETTSTPWTFDEPYGVYSRGGIGRTCIKFPEGDEDNECVPGNHWSYLTCYASAKSLKMQVLTNSGWKNVKGKFSRNDGCDGGAYPWTVNVHVKERTEGTKKYRVVNPAQKGFRKNVTRLTVIYKR